MSARLLAAGLAVAVTATTFAQNAPKRVLNLAFDQQGNVTLIAENVTVSEILAEWTRKGGGQFINGQKLMTTLAVPVRFENRPEAEVIASLLRSAAGYMIAPRPAGSPGPSRFNTLIVPTSTATASASSYSSSPVSSAVPVVSPGAVTDDIPPANPIAASAQDAKPPSANPLGMPGYGAPPASITIPTIQPIGPPNKPDPPPAPTTKPGGGRGGGTNK
jgi:hypothetical protein